MAFAIGATALPVPAMGSEPPMLVPADAKRFEISAETFKVNGHPSRVGGFLSTRSPADVARWYRQQLGEPVAENRIGNQQIIGKARDGHYITVQLTPVDGGTRGLVSVASLKEIQRHHEAELVIRERWQNRLPAGSQLLSHVSSADAGQAGTFIAYVNHHDESVNQASITRVLREEGLELEREAGTANLPVAHDTRAKAGTTMYFKGSGREAMATVFRTSDAKTAVILNITTKSGGDQ